MIKGKELKEQVKEELDKGLDVENAVYKVARFNLFSLNLNLRDWDTVYQVVQATQYYAQEVHPEFLTKEKVTDRVSNRIWGELRHDSNLYG